MASVQVLRIFLSSPGDVARERQLALDVIAELQREPQFQGIKLEAVSWDDPQGRTPLVAQIDPQTAVERGLRKPSQCDVVIGIFWARMGSPLPADKYRKADGSAYLSGTEYEIEDALGAKCGPDVLLYRRTEEPRWGARDPKLREKQKQFACLEAYLESLKAARRYISAYPTLAELKERLKNDVRKVITQRLAAAPISGTCQKGKNALAGVPYWSMLQAIVWVATRDLVRVSRLNPLRELSVPASAKELDKVLASECGRSITAADSARDELIAALQSDELRAIGLRAGRTTAVVPPLDWVHLVLAWDDKGHFGAGKRRALDYMTDEEYIEFDWECLQISTSQLLRTFPPVSA